MLRRLFALALLLWIFGFLWFSVTIPGSAGAVKTDAVIVLTGGEGRIARGLEVLDRGWAPRMLVSGVDREVTAEEFAVEYDIDEGMLKCCVTLGYQSYDTRSNAIEASRWLSRNDAKSVRLITTDWHMRRALHEIEAMKPDDVEIVVDGVPSEPSLRILFLEFHKYLAREAARLWN